MSSANYNSLLFNDLHCLWKHHGILIVPILTATNHVIMDASTHWSIPHCNTLPRCIHNPPCCPSWQASVLTLNTLTRRRTDHLHWTKSTMYIPVVLKATVGTEVVQINVTSVVPRPRSSPGSSIVQQLAPPRCTPNVVLLAAAAPHHCSTEEKMY